MVGRTKKRSTDEKEKDDDLDMDYAEAEVEPTERRKERKAKISPYRITKGESYMSDEQLEHFNNILLHWKYELMEEVDHTITEMKEAGVLADPNDRATQEETFNLELRTRDRERKLIKKIEEALQQIKDKEYGYCETCGIEIGIRRLEARPTATLCIDCKTLAEIQEKRA
jgi:DnaK suppressor protein